MRAIKLLALAGAGAVLVAAGVAADRDHVTPDQAKAEAQWLGDKQPGAPRQCIMASQVRGTQFVGERAILYRVSSNLVYKNEPRGGCPGLRQNSTLISRQPINQMCSGDILIVRDLITGFNGSSCALGEFVPYKRVR